MEFDSEDFLDEINGKSINFLIGSGASVGVVPTLWIDSLGKSFEQLFTSETFDPEQIKSLYYLWFNLWIKKTQITNVNSKIESVFKNYEKFISSLIAISNREGYDKPKRINIFTTNYDTLFELAFDNLASKYRLTFFNDGSRGFLKKYVSSENFYLTAAHSGISNGFERSIPTINLIKLHGSVTWKKSNDNKMIEMSLDNPAFKEIVEKAEVVKNKLLSKKEESETELTEAIEFFCKEDSILNECLTEEKIKKYINNINTIASMELDEFKTKYDQLPIVSPTKKKFSETVFEQHYYQMLRMLSFELEKDSSILIVFGFSFADEHILEIVRRSMVNPTLKIYVIAYDFKSKLTIEEALGKGTNIDFLPNFDDLDNSTKGDFDFLNKILEGKN
ncbi:SIR2 family protein [Enterococcus faecium]